MMMPVLVRRAALGLGLLLGLILAPPSAAAQSTAATTPDFSEIDSLRSEGAFRDAYARLNTFKNRYPESAPVYWRLALVQVDLGEVSESERTRNSLYEQSLGNARVALRLDSTDARAHLAVAVAEGRVALTAGTQEKIRRSRAVKRHSDRAIELDSTLASAYHVRARWNREVADLGFFSRTIVKTIYGGLPDASFEQAVRDFKTAIRLEDKVIHHLELGKTYLKMDREEEARAEFRTAINMNPVDPDAPLHKQEARDRLDDLG
jgi:tetratricopeptide (TPR) repeat protein